MFHEFLRRGGLIAMLPIGLGLLAAVLWFGLTDRPQMATKTGVIVDGIVAEKVTQHRPTYIVTNDQVTTRMVTDHLVTVTYPVGETDITFWQVKQVVAPSYYAALAPRQIVRVHYDRLAPNLVEILPDPPVGKPAAAIWFVLAMFATGFVSCVMVWRHVAMPPKRA